MLPEASKAIQVTNSSPAPPKRFDHRCAPLGEYLARNKSAPPALVNAPPPKSTDPWKYPATTMLPLPSTATTLPESYPVPPRALAQGPGGWVVLLTVTVFAADVVELPAAS